MKDKLTPRQAQVLILIATHPSASYRELGDLLGIADTNVKGHLNAMIRKGYLINPEHRCRSLRITDKGKAFIREHGMDSAGRVYERVGERGTGEDV